ncbi:glycosyltransferase [Geoglobus ahangari]
MAKMSAVVTAYREPEFLFEIVEDLVKRGYEVVVSADCLSEENVRRVRELGVKATLSNVRRGKWKALNDALELVTGDYVLFVDSDTKLIDIPNPSSDVVELTKEVRGRSIVERLVAVDYLLMNVSARISSKILGFSMVNGSAFISRADVVKRLGFRPKIIEDADFGFRAGFEGYRVAVSGRAVTKAPSTLKEWFRQRERWALGGAELFAEFLPKFLRMPKIVLPMLVLYYPAIVGFLLAMFLPDSIAIKLLYFLLPLLLSLPVKAVAIFMLLVFEFHLLRNILAMVVSFVLWVMFVALVARKYGFRLDTGILPVYYFLYSPLWTMVNVAMLFRYLILRLVGKEVSAEGWKVG